MKKEILTFIFNGYADWESAYVCTMLNYEKTDYSVKTISFDKEPKVSMGGFHVVPDYSINDYPEDFAMLLLIGGNAWMEKKNDDVKPLVDYAVQHNIPVAAICGATSFMGEHGYLDEVKHTSNTLDFLKQYCPHYKGEKNYIEKQAVNDNNIITANGTAALEFAREILVELKAEPVEQIKEWYEFHKRGFCRE